MLFHEIQDDFKQILKVSGHLIDLFSYIELHIKSHLIVTAPSGMETLPGVTDAIGKDSLNEAVNIFIFGCDLKLSGLNVLKDPIQTGKYCFLIFFGQHSGLCQHPDMSLRSFNILSI